MGNNLPPKNGSVLIAGFGENQLYNDLIIGAGGNIKIIESAHQAVHEDKFVMASYYNNNFDISGPLVVYIKPLPGFTLHCVFIIRPSAAARVQIFESPTISANGTRFLHMRNNRGSLIDDTARDTTFHTPTVSDNGTAKMDTYTGGQGGGVANRIGGESRSGQEIKITNKGLLIIITSTADNALLAVHNEYYEVPIE